MQFKHELHRRRSGRRFLFLMCSTWKSTLATLNGGAPCRSQFCSLAPSTAARCWRRSRSPCAAAPCPIRSRTLPPGWLAWKSSRACSGPASRLSGPRLRRRQAPPMSIACVSAFRSVQVRAGHSGSREFTPERKQRGSRCGPGRRLESSPAPSLQRLALAPLRPRQPVQCGQDQHPGRRPASSPAASSASARMAACTSASRPCRSSSSLAQR